MSRPEWLVQRIAELDPSEPKALQAWFERYEIEVRAIEIESAANKGELSQLAERAVADRQAVSSTEL